VAIDTLAYTKALEAAGIERPVAEAHAEALIQAQRRSCYQGGYCSARHQGRPGGAEIRPVVESLRHGCRRRRSAERHPLCILARPALTRPIPHSAVRLGTGRSRVFRLRALSGNCRLHSGDCGVSIATVDALARAYGPWWLCNDVTRLFWQSGPYAGPEREVDMVAVPMRAVAPCPDAVLRGTRQRGRGSRVTDPSSLS
jgi:hypothetical protein